ncbi:hypothetical protein DL770_002588 [Monosporascus sp. CRB-9-2]|nr:hypothetical protein DL770_002588 [Monosporascus sp. CRB-9-2]
MDASYAGITEMNISPGAWGNDEMTYAISQDIGVEEVEMSTPSHGILLESAAFEPDAFARNITLESSGRDQYGTDDIFSAQDFIPQLALHEEFPLDCEYQEPPTNENWKDAFLLAQLPQALEPVAGISDTPTGPESDMNSNCDGATPVQNPFTEVIVDLSVPPERVATDRSAPLTMKRFGEAFMLHLMDSRKYVGILMEPALIRVIKDYTVQLEAMLVVSGPPLPQGKARLKSKLPQIKPIHSVRIVVTGLKHEKSAVGNILSEAGLFLQHPSANEYDGQLEYCNPHYLLRPGGAMPDLQHFALDNPPGEAHQLRPLNETHKSRYMKIFDSVDAKDVPMNAQASPRLKSVLMEYESDIAGDDWPTNILSATDLTGHGPREELKYFGSYLRVSRRAGLSCEANQSWLVSGDAYSHAEIDLDIYAAHHIRNRSSQTFQAACAIKARYRWCLTGTPIHNSLDDYGALLSFIGVPSLAEKAQFDFWITSALKDQTPRYMQRLRDLIRATCLRRTKGTLPVSSTLPKPVEKVEPVVLHGDDRVLYEFFKNQAASLAANFTQKKPPGAEVIGSGRNNILSLINFLRLICNHGEQLLPTAALRAWKARDATSIDWGMMQSPRKRCDLCHADIEESYNLGSGYSNANCIHLHSVIFTYWTKMLNLVEQALKKHGFNFKRMDGQTRLQDRTEALRLFNEDPKCTIFLATIGSAGEGVNLTAATHVHLIEPHWNPMVEAQAVDRVHRIGQTRQVTVTRYIVSGSIETYMQWIQQEKLRLVNQSLESCDISQADIDSRRWNVTSPKN